MVKGTIQFDHLGNWTFPYPAHEHDFRVMCGDPVAVAFDTIEKWIKAQTFKPPVHMQEMIACLWANTPGHGNFMTKYDIVRGATALPHDFPDHIHDLIPQLFGDF